MVPEDGEEDIKAEIMADLRSLQSKLSAHKKGVTVQGCDGGGFNVGGNGGIVAIFAIFARRY